jgi:hypothetical protein
MVECDKVKVVAILLFLYLIFALLSENMSYLIKFVLLPIAFILNLKEVHYIKIHYTKSYLSVEII